MKIVMKNKMTVAGLFILMLFCISLNSEGQVLEEYFYKNYTKGKLAGAKYFLVRFHNNVALNEQRKSQMWQMLVEKELNEEKYFLRGFWDLYLASVEKNSLRADSTLNNYFISLQLPHTPKKPTSPPVHIKLFNQPASKKRKRMNLKSSYSELPPVLTGGDCVPPDHILIPHSPKRTLIISTWTAQVESLLADLPEYNNESEK